VSQQLGLRHKTLGMRAHQLVSLLRHWLPGVPIKLMGDLAYSILELGLHCKAHQITLIAPFRLDSVIHQPPPARNEHTYVMRNEVMEELSLDLVGQGTNRLP
jgi:hypothetical protein